jgi:hypothetical protein
VQNAERSAPPASAFSEAPPPRCEMLNGGELSRRPFSKVHRYGAQR